MPIDRQCSCKGIRTCLLCEEETSIATKPNLYEEAKCMYTYCPHCNLCWPDGEHFDPLFLDDVKIFPDFISEDEEPGIISNIDKIAWVPSQSGRRKQDFGPKVNFKKKKVRIGEFRGFPKFASLLSQRFQSLPELSDFHPVELCHLEYTPDRGSSIDPHIDDFWLWGERLVTINLGSPTVLTLVPSTDCPCDCREKCNSKFSLLPTVGSCHHKFGRASAKESTPTSTVTTDRNDFDYDSFHRNSTDSPQNSEINRYQNGRTKSDQQECLIGGGSISVETTLQSDSPAALLTGFCDQNGKNLRTMCSLFRNKCSVSKAAVRIVLPPRSLIVLAGCARYNWTHEIKRQDVVSRRLAMTFRELTPEFLHGGKESVLGKELLTIANNICDL